MSAWPRVPLGDIFEIARGGSPRPIDDYITDADDGVNWISIADASDSAKYIERTKRRIRPEGIARSRLVAPGDFLLTNSMSFGRPYIMRTSGCIHDGWLVLGKKRDGIDQDFFYRLLGSDTVYAAFSRLAAGATVKNLNIDLVKGVEVPVPPFDEQRRIAAILDQADALRAQRRRALAELDKLAQVVFVEMFGDTVTNSMEWPFLPIGKLADVQGGLQVTSARKELPIEVPYLRVANVHRGYLLLDEIKTIRATAAEVARTTLCHHDLLVVEGHGNPEEIGRAALWSGELRSCVHQNHLIRVRFDNSKVDPVYACTYMNSTGGRRHLLRASKTTSGLNTISVSNVREAPVALPPVELQKTFAARVGAIEAHKATRSAALAESDALFTSLQHHAFSGAL